ncbi:MAG: FAD-binding protein [Acidobacteria bacterium]|nr:MAG: FAD-binding protein [Acidobacteriota bacterium]
MTATVPRREAWIDDAVEPERRSLESLAREILERCRGDGPANCVARCPLHVDARAYVQLAREGRFDEALQKVREKLPFPGILGYVCAHPCELHCKRIDEDAAVRIRDIKRFLAEREQGEPRHILDREPDRGVAVAVVGSGPAGLIAAHDLARRGYAVTLFEADEQLGGCLRARLPDWRLPRRVLERELTIIPALGIEVRCGVRVGRDVSLDELRERFRAVLLLVGYAGALDLLGTDGAALGTTTRGTVYADPLTLETRLEGVFAGGDALAGPGTVVHAMALGRRAAESAHRFLEGRDLREEREPVLPPRILWTLEIDEAERQRRQRAPVMLQPFNPPMTEAEVIEEAGRCLDCTCGLCVEDCEFLARYCRAPRELAREILERGLEGEVLRKVYSCNICSLCARVCPEDLDTGAMLLEARREAVAAGRGPLPEHKPIVNYWKVGVSRAFSLVMPEPGRARSRRLFFTGCALPAVAPRRTLAIYDELRRLDPGTGVLMLCCGAPVELLGMEAQFAATREKVLEMARSVGAEELVAACPDCAHTLSEAVPELKVTTVWERLAGRFAPPVRHDGVTVAVHDSCKARHMDGVHDGIRTLIEGTGARVEEIEYDRDKARCCGFGGMIYPVDPELSQRISDRRAAESPHPMVTYCAGCRMALRGRGKDSLHVTDLLYGTDWREAARAPAPGSLRRYWNRLRTRWAFRRLRPIARGDRP